MGADADFIGGHGILALERFMDETRHMIIFDVLTWEAPVGDKGERLRLFLSDEGYANVLIIGGSGSGKTRFWLKPNLLQCTSKTYPVSFVVTDPKGSIVTECGNALRRNQYRIKILNTMTVHIFVAIIYFKEQL